MNLYVETQLQTRIKELSLGQSIDCIINVQI